MKPRIAAISGKLEDTIISMNEGPVLIGRQTGATLKIANASVSRRHAVIERDGDRFMIADLGSRNGTFVNDIPVKRRELHHGDRVRIGESQFFFLFEETEDAPRTSEIRFDDSEVSDSGSVRMSYEDALGLMARDLNVLMKVSLTINAIRDLEELQEELLGLIFEVVPARHGAILLVDERKSEDAPEFASMFALDRLYGANQKVTVSSTVVRRVLKDQKSLLVGDAAKDESLNTTSLIAAHSRSLLCVPLLLHGTAVGVIYLDSDRPEVRFDADHLQIVTAIAAIAAIAIQNVRQVGTLETENRRLRTEAGQERCLIGESDSMKEIFEAISRAAETESSVLISGENGTGKELAARAIHNQSKRAAKAFVALSCAGIADALLQSELFGHEKGAFTGALVQRKGRLESADGGTIFLDDVGELSPALQLKLLQVLEEREFTRVGGERPIKLNVRVIAATNQKLDDAIASGSFRQDLYFRLNVVKFKMPPLRERPDDIPILANYFAAKHASRCNRTVQGISAEAHEILRQYSWPGNVREMENAIERAVIKGTGDYIRPQDLPINS